MEFSFSFKCFGDHRDLHSFPTRRSSDLRDAQVEGGGVHARVAQSDRDGRGDEEEGGRDVEGAGDRTMKATLRSEEHTSELQSHSDLVCRLLLEKKKRSRPHPAGRQLQLE